MGMLESSLADMVRRQQFVYLRAADGPSRLALPRLLGTRGTKLVLVANLGVDKGNYVVMSEWISVELPGVTSVTVGAEAPWNGALDAVPQQHLEGLDNIIAQT